MRSKCAWYCPHGHIWTHDSIGDNLHPIDHHRPAKCPTCDVAQLSGPFWDEAQAEFVYLKRLDNVRLSA